MRRWGRLGHVVWAQAPPVALLRVILPGIVFAVIAGLLPAATTVSAAAPAISSPAERPELVGGVAMACGPRPDFQLSTSMQLDGRLLVIVSPTAGGSAINSLRFGDPRPLTNAKIDIGNLVGQSGAFTYQF